MGKGSWYRPVDKKKYDEGWERAFGKQTWFCQKVRTGPGDSCGTCKYNPDSKETHEILFCPETKTEPDRSKCDVDNEANDDAVQEGTIQEEVVTDSSPERILRSN